MLAGGRHRARHGPRQGRPAGRRRRRPRRRTRSRRLARAPAGVHRRRRAVRDRRPAARERSTSSRRTTAAPRRSRRSISPRSAEHEVTLVLDVTGVHRGHGRRRRRRSRSATRRSSPSPIRTGGSAIGRRGSVRGIQEARSPIEAGAFRFTACPTARTASAPRGPAPRSRADARRMRSTPARRAAMRLVSRRRRLDHRQGPARRRQGAAAILRRRRLGTYPMPFASGDGTFAVGAPSGTATARDRRPRLRRASAMRDIKITEGKDTDIGTITVAARSLGHRPRARCERRAGRQATRSPPVRPHRRRQGAVHRRARARREGHRDRRRRPVRARRLHTRRVARGRRQRDSAAAPASCASRPAPTARRSTSCSQPTTGVDGKVTRDGEPLADTVVIANPTGWSAPNFFVVTGPDGTFAFDSLARAATSSIR